MCGRNVQLHTGRVKSVSWGVRGRWEAAGLIEVVNGLSETIIVPDVAHEEALHHHIQSHRTALTQ